MKAVEVMTRSPRCAYPGTSLEMIARMMIECDCGAIPIVADHDARFPIGMITDRDIVVRVVANGMNPCVLTARDCLTVPALTVLEDADLTDVIELLEDRKVRRLLVVDRAGALTGIIAQADIANHASKRKAGDLLKEVSRPPGATVTTARF